MRVAVFDYGAGNIFSIKVALERLNANVDVINDMSNLDAYNALILPGVGNFDPAISSINPYIGKLMEAIDSHMPMLGICLGMEMLFERSEEGSKEGLSVLKGDVTMLPRDRVKVPHMGWNRLKINDAKSIILKGIDDDPWVYFVHSYHVNPSDDGVVKAKCIYGREFPAVIEYKGIVGTQFHPEKSGKVGMLMLKNFLDNIR